MQASICMQCLELTSNHKLLSCNHTICTDCAETLFANEITRQQTPYMNGGNTSLSTTNEQFTRGIAALECPVCHEKTNIPTTSSPQQSLKSVKSDTHSAHVHFPCGGECGKTATVECVKCEIQFCDACFERIHAFGAMRNHDCIRVSAVQDEKYCQRHTGQRLDLYCQDCQLLVCQRCIVYESDHKGHQYVVVEQFREQCLLDLDAVRKELKGKQTILEKARKEVKQTADALHSRQQSIEKQINEKFGVLLQSLEVRKKELLQQVQEAISTRSRLLDSQLESLDQCGTQIQEIDNLIDETVKSRPSAFEAAQAKQTAVSLNHNARIDPEILEPRIDVEATTLSLDVDHLKTYITSLGDVVNEQGDGRRETPVRFSPRTPGLRTPGGLGTPKMGTPSGLGSGAAALTFDQEPWEMKLKLPKPGVVDMPNIADIISKNTGLYSQGGTPNLSKSQPIRPVRANTTKTPKSVSWLNQTPSSKPLVRANTSTRIVTGDVLAMGGNEHGQLGTGSKDDAFVATHVIGLHNQGIVSIAAGDVHTLALSDNGDVFSFGNNDMGQLGVSDNRPRSTVQVIMSLQGRPITKIAAGRYFSAALTDRGELFTWGDNDCGQLGHGDRQDKNEPTLVEGALAGLKITDITAGASFMLCKTVDDEVYGWGSNQMGQLSTGDGENRLAPTLIECFKGLELVEIVTGGHHCLAVTEEGELMAWGWNRYGQLGLGDDDSRNVAEYVTPLRSIKLESVSAGAAHSVALTVSGDLYSWGRNNHGQLGLGDRIDRFQPQYVSNLIDKIDRVFCNSSAWHTFVVLKNGTVKSFGWNHKAQLGVKTKEEHDEVQTVRSLQGRKVISITAGGQHSLVVTE